MNPNDARLFADFAAVPTPRERKASRTYWRAAQMAMDAFAAALADDATACPVCAGDHDGPCTLGTAGELF